MTEITYLAVDKFRFLVCLSSVGIVARPFAAMRHVAATVAGGGWHGSWDVAAGGVRNFGASAVAAAGSTGLY